MAIALLKNPKLFLAPVTERGKFSLFKTITLIALLTPGLVTLFRFIFGLYAAQPVREVIFAFGLWTIRFLMLALAITPARFIFKLPELLAVRRMIGVAAFCYIAIHFTFFMADKMFDLGVVATEIVSRIYLAIGAAAILLLLALAVTSADGMVKKLGGKNWQMLHRLVYVAATLGLIHYFMQAKLAVGEPTVVAGIFLWLMGFRIVMWTASAKRAASLPALLILSLAAFAVTVLGEAAYYSLARNIDAWKVLEANVNFTGGPRPAWYVLIFGLLVSGAAYVKSLRDAKPQAPPPARATASGRAPPIQ